MNDSSKSECVSNANDISEGNLQEELKNASKKR